MAIEYRITLDDQHQLNYRIELERHYDPQAAAAAPRWTRLEHNRCSNCPLDRERYSQEFVLRVVPLYLMRQYFNFREGRHADWELKGLVRLFQQLQLVNQAFWQRIHDTCVSDSNLKAFLTFFSLSSSISYSLETQLQKIRPLVMSAEETLG